MLGGRSRLTHSNIYGILPVEKINVEMKVKCRKNCYSAEVTVVPSVEL